jgi:hypothetical protein
VDPESAGPSWSRTPGRMPAIRADPLVHPAGERILLLNSVLVKLGGLGLVTRCACHGA